MSHSTPSPYHAMDSPQNELPIDEVITSSHEQDRGLDMPEGYTTEKYMKDLELRALLFEALQKARVTERETKVLMSTTFANNYELVNTPQQAAWYDTMSSTLDYHARIFSNPNDQLAATLTQTSQVNVDIWPTNYILAAHRYQLHNNIYDLSKVNRYLVASAWLANDWFVLINELRDTIDVHGRSSTSDLNEFDEFVKSNGGAVNTGNPFAMPFNIFYGFLHYMRVLDFMGLISLNHCILRLYSLEEDFNFSHVRDIAVNVYGKVTDLGLLGLISLGCLMFNVDYMHVISTYRGSAEAIHERGVNIPTGRLAVTHTALYSTITMQSDLCQLSLLGFSLFSAEFPTCYFTSGATVMALIRSFALPTMLKTAQDNGYVDVLRLESSKHIFKNKTGANLNKMNVYASEVILELSKHSPAVYEEVARYSSCMLGLSNDQVAAIILYVGCSYEVLGVELAMAHAVMSCYSSQYAKGFNTIIKSVGLNSTKAGAICCETLCLQGRGVAGETTSVDAARRIGHEGAALAVDCNQALLRDAVMSILDEELPTGVYDWGNYDDFLTKRWLWAKNGAHNMYVHKANSDIPTPIKYGDRIHRRAALEQLSISDLKKWDGNVYASASVKEELGKNRVIYGVDTISSIPFTHLLNVVEKRWRGKHAILDPGGIGPVGMMHKQQKLQKDYGWSVMADYEDFNSQHSIASMQLVMELTCQYVGYNTAMTSKIVSSFDNTWIVDKGELVGKVGGTLMSGHRATSYINTVLNRAYFLMAMKTVGVSAKTFHVGDDVVCGFNSGSDAFTVIKAMRSLGFRLNPLKQCISRSHTEFLRLVYTGTYVYGYLARSVGSAVAGSWVNDNPLDGLQCINSLVSQARTMINRGAGELGAKLLASSAHRVTGLNHKDLYNILTTKLGINGAPIYSAGGTYVGVNVQTAKDAKLDAARCIHLATSDYLSNHVKDTERDILAKLRINPSTSMLAASYDKDLAGPTEMKQRQHLVITKRVRVALHSKRLYSDVHFVKPKDYLVEFPLVKFMVKSLDAGRLYNLACILGINTLDYRSLLTGGERSCNAVDGCVPYALSAWYGQCMSNTRILARSVHMHF